MPTLNHSLLAHFLPKLLSSACPAVIPRSGIKGSKVNCFSTFILENGEPNLLLTSVENERVEALRYDGNSYSSAVNIELKDIDPCQISVTHYYGLSEVQYVGIRSVALGLWTRWPYVSIRVQGFGDTVLQHLFNRRTLEVRRRLDILRDVLDACLEGANEISLIGLMVKRHGTRWIAHPSKQAYKNIIREHLNLLVQSGELEKTQNGYRPTGLALKTIEESEEQDRKHSANIRVQSLLALLALFTLVMAAAQAGVIKLPTLIDLSPSESNDKSIGTVQLTVTMPAGTTNLLACTPIAPASGVIPTTLKAQQ